MTVEILGVDLVSCPVLELPLTTMQSVLTLLSGLLSYWIWIMRVLIRIACLEVLISPVTIYDFDGTGIYGYLFGEHLTATVE